MEYSSMLRSRRLPGIVRSRTDDEDPSVCSFPDERSNEEDDGAYDDKKKRRSKSSPGGKGRTGGSGKRAGRGKKEVAVDHPYPSSISITIESGRDASPTDGGRRWTKRPSRGSEFRSPVTSPSRGHKEDRQPHSPASPPGKFGGGSLETDLTAHHASGLHHFQCNRLSESVDAYSLAIRAGLDELTHRKEVVARMGRSSSKQDEVVVQLGETLAQVHIDMGKTLEVAQKYREAKLEWENGVGMLTHTCGVDRNDKRVKSLKKDVGRVDRAISVERERKAQTKHLDRAFEELKASSGKQQKEARKGVISALKKLMRTERDSLGEQSHAHAKLRLKLAKAKCEGGDLAGGLEDADAAVVTLKKVLGNEHTLVGAACLFCAAVHKRRAALLGEKSETAAAEHAVEAEVSPEAKAAMNRALERYGDALAPLNFKYDVTDRSDEGHKSTHLRPDVGEVHHKIALLYSMKSSHASAVDAFHRALEAYGASGFDRHDVSKKKKVALRDVHPEAVMVWHDLARVHLKGSRCSDAVYAAERAIELAHQVLKSTTNEKIEGVPVSAYRLAGDAYGGLGRHADAARSYQEARKEFQKLARSGSKDTALGLAEEAAILHKLGMSLSHQGRSTEAKSHLMDALRVLRSSKGADASARDMPALLKDMGAVHLQCGEYAEATNALRLCLKQCDERGLFDHHPTVEEAQRSMEEAQRGPMAGGNPKMAAGGPSKLVAETPLSTGPSTAGTPQSHATASTVPSSTGYSRASSGGGTLRSGHGQLQTLLEELASPEGTSGGQGAEHSAIPKPPAADVYEMQRLKSKLEEAEKTAQQFQLRVKEVEAERDQERKERIFATAAHRKEMEAMSQTNMNKAVDKSEVEALRKELNVTETSYQALLKAIDDEKERIGSAHEAEVRNLEEEIGKLQNQLKTAGAVENHRLSIALSKRVREADGLMNQGQKLSAEIAKLKSANLAVQSEKDAALRESSRLRANNEQLQEDLRRVSSELAESKARLEAASRKPTNNVELKNLEFELQSERSRRMILEASLQKEYDRGSSGMGVAYPMMPFGYPPMAPHDNNMAAKVKTLEIDLATERASKEMLQNVIKELRSTHEQERDAMEAQYSSYVSSSQQETSELLVEVGTKEAEVNQLCLELDEARSSVGSLSSQLDDAMLELSDVKQQLMQTSAELKDLGNVRAEMKNAKCKLSQKETDNKFLTEEVRMSTDKYRRKESERNYLSEENGRLKKEYHEAITLFESEMDRVKGDRDEVQSTLGSELERLQNEFDTAKLHLKNVLSELEGANRTIGSMHSDTEHLKLAIDNARADADTKEEELKQAGREIEELSTMYQEMQAKMSELESVVSREQQARKDKETVVRETESRLHEADKTIEELRESIHRLGEVEGEKKRLERALQSISRKLEKVLPAEVDAAVDSAPDDEESQESRISRMLGAVGDYCKHLKAAAKANESALEKTQWNLTNAANDLDKLEAKHKTLKEELAEMGDLQGEYDELLEQYEIVVEEKENLEESLKANYLEKEEAAAESLQEAMEERDLFESRLKEAVDDLEELESERDSLREEIDRARADFAQKETSMSSMITALETDNKLIEQLEGQALEYEAILSEKDEKLKKLALKLQGHATSTNTNECSAPQVLASPTERSDCDIYPDLLPGNAICSSSGSYAETSTNPFNGDAMPDAQHLLDVKKIASNPFDEDSVDKEEVAELKARLEDLESQNDGLRKKLEQASLDTGNDEIALLREREAMIEEIADLKSYIQALEESNAVLREEAEVSASLRNSDCEAISILQNELEVLRTQNEELQESSGPEEVTAVNDTDPSNGIDEKSAEELGKLKIQIDALEEQNAQLSAQLAEVASSQVDPSEQEAMAQQISSLKSHIETLEADNDALSKKLAQSAANAGEADVEAWKSRATDAEEAHEKDQATIMTLQNALNEKDELYQADVVAWKARAVEAQEALNEKESMLRERLQQEEPWKSQVVELKESNAALNRELSELSAQTSIPEDHTECNEKLSSLQMELQNALNGQEERTIQHNLELASINAELHNAMMSLDELQKENEKLKGDIESLSSIQDSQESDESKNFEQEMNAAHSRFVSMENALQERVHRLEREKNQLIADFNAEMTTMEDEHSQTKIELSAWKLEMQNALNDIEGLKKERDSLKEQVQAYVASLEAVCTGKAELEEQVHSLGLGR